MRECGDCNLCCTGVLTVKIFEHKVFPGNACPLVCSSGCSIFNDQARPEVCSSYRCAWLQDQNIPEYLKPNKSNFILTFYPDCLLMTGDPSKQIDASAFLWVANYCALYNKKLFYTIKSFSGDNFYDRGDVMLSSPTMRTGTMEQIYDLRELFK